MQTSKSVEDFFLDEQNDSDLWHWERNIYSKYHWRSLVDWSSEWLSGSWDGFKNWLYLLYHGSYLKRIAYNRCRLCQGEIDPEFLYQPSDLRHELCLSCYDIECQRIIEQLTLD